MEKPYNLVPAQNRLGETPIWNPEEKALYWVDWGGMPSCRYEPSTGRLKTFPVSESITAIARRGSGGWIAVAQNGLFAWDDKSNNYKLLVGPPDQENPDIGFNDCAVDRQGRLLVGTTNMQDGFSPEGSLYRLDPDHSLHKLDGGYATANGIGISPDGKTVYVTDMRHHQIIALDYDIETGTVYNRRIFAKVSEEEGMPDGLIVDSEGYVWSGHWAGWKLTRYDPDGKVERQIEFPVQHVISFAFGGENLDELYVTTASWGFSDKEKAEQPLAGNLFLLRPEVKGLIEPAFEG